MSYNDKTTNPINHNVIIMLCLGGEHWLRNSICVKRLFEAHLEKKQNYEHSTFSKSIEENSFRGFRE
jgi:hypothetical protein